MAPDDFTHAKGCPLWHGTGNYCNCPGRPRASNKAAGQAGGASTPRTPEERERLYKMMDRVLYPTFGVPWEQQGAMYQKPTRDVVDKILTVCPALWDSLPPDPAETARKEAEEDGRTVESWRRMNALGAYSGAAKTAVDSFLGIMDRMTARAAAGYPVLIAPKGEK